LYDENDDFYPFFIHSSTPQMRPLCIIKLRHNINDILNMFYISSAANRIKKWTAKFFISSIFLLDILNSKLYTAAKLQIVN